MQSIYAFNKTQESNYYLGISQINERFKDALMFHGKDHKERLDEEKAQAIALYRTHFLNGREGDLEGSELVVKSAWESIRLYQSQDHSEFRVAVRKMLSETEHLFNKYLRLIILMGTLADYIKDVHQEKLQKTGRPPKPDFSRFFNNPILQRIRAHEEVKKEKFHWEIEKIVDWSKLLRKQDEFLTVIAEAAEGIEGDKDIIKCVIRDFLFKNEAIYSYFDEHDLNWNENRSVLRNMLLKTVKGIDTEEGEVDLFSLSRNWEEDKNFFEILFRNTIHEDQHWETRIAAKAQRWASDRIATIDKILLKMALSEMSCFPSIPVKVSINEYIEISKIYSTPKSWQFMNGILDAIAQDLQEEGFIRKSGRGLIDNK